MTDKAATSRLRRAVKDNNLFLVKRLIQRTEMRNPDPLNQRYTSLQWAAVMGHEDTFEFFLTAGHDDEEISRDAESNTVLMLLAETKLNATSPYSGMPPNHDAMQAALRMSKLYYERFDWVLDWQNAQGKTALHIASLKGNEELVRMLCDFGADYDLADNLGNTPLHYASTWGHIPVVQTLIERGCQFTARNNEGFTASDYAYSFNTRDTLQNTARLQFENNKKSRRGIFAQAAARGSHWGGSQPIDMPPPVPIKSVRDFRKPPPRMRSGSGTSRTTNTSDSGEQESNRPPPPNAASVSSSSVTSSSSINPTPSFLHMNGSSRSGKLSAGSNGSFSLQPQSSHSNTLNAPAGQTFSLSPIATRMRERDADAMAQYMMRNRSGSQGASSQISPGLVYAGPAANGDDFPVVESPLPSGSSTPRRLLRPSVSAAQLRTTGDVFPTAPQIDHPPHRDRSGTNPTAARPNLKPLHLSRSNSQSNNSRSPKNSISSSSGSANQFFVQDDGETYTGPPSQYAQFPDPPSPMDSNNTPTVATLPVGGRRLPFNILSKPGYEIAIGHRRGASGQSAAVRG